MQVKKTGVNLAAAFALLLLAAVLLQTTVLSDVRLFGAKALFLIPLTLCVGLFNGTKAGCFFGLALGFLVDSTTSEVFGLLSLILLAVGIFSGFVAEYLVVRHFFAALLLYATVYFCLIAADLLLRLTVTGQFASFPAAALTQGLSALASLFYLPLCYLLAGGLHHIFVGEDDA